MRLTTVLDAKGQPAHIAGSPFEVFIDIQQNTDPAVRALRGV